MDPVSHPRFMGENLHWFFYAVRQDYSTKKPNRGEVILPKLRKDFSNRMEYGKVTVLISAIFVTFFFLKLSLFFADEDQA